MAKSLMLYMKGNLETNMNIIIYIFTLIISCLLSVLTSFLRGGLLSIDALSNLQISSLTSFFIYYIFTFVIIHKKQNISSFYLLLSILIGASLLQLPIRIMNFESTLSTLLDYLISLIGIISGYVTFKIKKKRILFIVLLCLGGTWFSTFGNDLWINKLNYSTSTGKVDDNTGYTIKFQNAEGDTINIESLNKQFILVECWFSHCRECYKEMPRVQRIYDKYKHNSSINIFALHCRIEKEKENYKTGESILFKKGYDIPVLSININDSLLKEMKVKVFPTTLIFNNHKLVFRGSVKSAEKYLDEVIAINN